MSVRELILDPASLDFNNVIADAAEIRKYNPQRFEMEQLTAIVYEDLSKHICAGYKDVTNNEFWVRGHMPNMPLMPGVVMLGAQRPSQPSWWTAVSNRPGNHDPGSLLPPFAAL